MDKNKNELQPAHGVKTISEGLGITERQVQKLAKKGILPKSARGGYNLKDCIAAYEGYLENQIDKKGVDQKEILELKKRLLAAQVEKSELELAVMQDKYMEISEVEFLWSGMVLAFRSKMLSLPTKLTPSLAATGSDFIKIEHILENEINEALLLLSKYRDDETTYNTYSQ